MKIRTEPWRSKVTPKDTWVLKQISQSFTGWEDPALEVEGGFRILETLFKNTIVGYKYYNKETQQYLQTLNPTMCIHKPTFL